MINFHELKKKNMRKVVNRKKRVKQGKNMKERKIG